MEKSRTRSTLVALLTALSTVSGCPPPPDPDNGVIPSSQIPPGAYASREVNAKAYLVNSLGNRLLIKDSEIYHGIYFGSLGEPWDYDENGPTRPIKAGDKDSMGPIFSEITSVTSTGNTVTIRGLESMTVLGTQYQGQASVSYTYLPNDTLQFKGEKDLETSGGSGYEIYYDGSLTHLP